MDISCAILAGGTSRRMGRDKTTVTLFGRSLIQHVYEKAARVFDNIIILSRHHGHFEGIDAPVLPDVLPQRGAMVGIASALLYASTPYVFILACDMPNLNEKTLAYMAGEVHGEDVVIPHTHFGYEALHAIYNRSSLSYFLTSIERQRFMITDVLPYLSVRELGEHPLFVQKGQSVFANINREEELSAASQFDGAGVGEIRAMGAPDLEGVIAIEKRSFPTPWTKRLFEEALLSPIAANFIIETGEGLAGYLCLYTVEDEAHILNIAIQPDLRKKGYASVLMRHVIERLKEKGIAQFYLEVREGNKEAIRLYHGFGFIPIGKRKKYYTDTNEDALVMHLAIGEA